MKLLRIKNFVFNTLLALANTCIFFCQRKPQNEERGLKMKGQEEEAEKQFPVFIVSLVQIAFGNPEDRGGAAA